MAHLNEAAVKKISEICDRYANETTPLMMILSDIQTEYGYIPIEVQELVSEKTGISASVRPATSRGLSRSLTNSRSFWALPPARPRRTGSLRWTRSAASALAVSPLP